MKRLLTALIVSGFAVTCVQAQSNFVGTSANSKFAKNYNICIKGDKYTPCAPGEIGDPIGRTSSSASVSMNDVYVHMGYNDDANHTRYRSRSGAKVTIDAPDAPYTGTPNMANDGVEKNRERNLNYTNPVDLPPNTGRIGL